MDGTSKFVDAVTVQERLDDPRPLEERLAEDASDPVATTQLELHYRRTSQWRELMELLLTRAEQAAWADEAAEYMEEAAAAACRLGDRDAARLILLTAFEQEPTSLRIANELDRLCFEDGDWQDVLNAYLLAAAHSQDLAHTGSLWLRSACAHAVSTGDTEALIGALERIDELDPSWAQDYLDAVEARAHSAEVLLLLSQLCARIGDWERRARCMSRAIASAASKSERARIHHLLGLQREKFDEPSDAEWHFREALRLDSGRAESHAHLIALLKRLGRAREAAEILTSKAYSGQGQRAEAAYEAALLFADLDENTRCYDLLNVTVAADPDHVSAAVILAERYFREERWQELEVLIETLIEREHHVSELSAVELRFRAGLCAAHLGKLPRARDHFRCVLELAPEHEPALFALGDVLERAGDFAGANAAHRQLLQLIPPQETLTRVEILCKVARSLAEQGFVPAAIEQCQEILEHVPTHLPAAEQLATLHERLGQLAQAIEIRRLLASLVEAGDVVAQRKHIARLCSALGDPYAALGEYQEILALEPHDRQVLHQVFEHHCAAESWQAAADVVSTIAELETDAWRRGRYWQAAGVILWDKCGDVRAANELSQALECFFAEGPTRPGQRERAWKCFQKLVSIQRQQGNYLAIEAAYKKMIRRSSAEDPLAVSLWKELGELYKDQMQRPKDAITAFEVAASLEQDNTCHQRALAELYASMGREKRQEAIDSRHQLLAGHPEEIEHYRALHSLYLQGERYDRAWCAARALVFLNQATASERAFFEHYRPREVRFPSMPMTPEQWGELSHRGERNAVAGVFALVGDLLLQQKQVAPSILLQRDGNSPLHEELRNIVGGVAFALGLTFSRITVDLDIHDELLVLPTSGSYAVVVGGGFLALSGLQARAYAAARVLAGARARARLRTSVRSIEELEAVYWGCRLVVDSSAPVPPHLDSACLAVASVLRKCLPANARLQLVEHLRAVDSGHERALIQEWFEAIDATARRVATLLCGDLALAAQAIEREAAWSGRPASEMLADMLVSSVSAPHAELRDDIRVEMRAHASMALHPF